MLTSGISRSLGAGGPNGTTLGNWLKYIANRFVGAKPITVGANSSTVPLTSSIVKSQNLLVPRWNIAERWNQFTDRSHLINLYSKQYRYVLPSPRARLRGFGTLFGFAALVPTIRSVDSENEREDMASSLLSQSAKSNAAVCANQDADVQKLEDLHIFRRATNADGDAWVLRGALGAFIAKRNRVVDAMRIEEVNSEGFRTEEMESSIMPVEEMECGAVHAHPISGTDSTSSEYSIVEEDSVADCANVAEDQRACQHDESKIQQTINVYSCCNGKSVYDELEQRDDRSSDYSVISDEATECQFNPSEDTQLPGTRVATNFNEKQSVCETVFECSEPRKYCLPMRNDSTQREAVQDHVAQWLSCTQSDSTLSTESDTSAGSFASADTLLRTLHDTAEYFVYAFADRHAIPTELMSVNARKLHYQCAWHLVLPRFSVLHVPIGSVLSDQLMAANATRLGAVRFDSTPTASSMRATARARLTNAGGIIRSLFTMATLKDASELQLHFVVRQRPVPIRSFLRQLELEGLDTRSRSFSHCARAFDIVMLQLLEFGWTALMADRLRFASNDFEQLIDALGVEVDASGTPRVVLLGNVDSFDALFAPTRHLAHAKSTAREAFAAFAFVVHLNVSRVADALQLTGTLEPRSRLVHLMYAAREENVEELRTAMDNLRTC